MIGFSTKRGWKATLAALMTITGCAFAHPVMASQVAALDKGATTATPQPPGPTSVVARIDISDQTMHVYVGERLEHIFTVSTGQMSHWTPTGRWNAEWLSPKHRSRKYNNAPMPWSVFFYKGYAVHGTTDLKRLGQPASKGCIRLHPDNAKIFYSLVKTNGKQNTLISIVR